MISKLRTKKSTANYALITEQDTNNTNTTNTKSSRLLAFSPINKITKLQTSLLQEKLQQMITTSDTSNMSISCYYAMRYWYPFTAEVFDSMKRDRITKLIIVPLYPQVR